MIGPGDGELSHITLKLENKFGVNAELNKKLPSGPKN
jgi:hypothetical protein